jgi:hypothetical protein
MEDFSSYLLSGEKIVWTGRPREGVLIGPMDAFLIPFSLVWGGFALFWNAQVWATDAPAAFKLFGLPFLIAGIYLVAGRFWTDAIIRKHQFYAVTNKRVLIRRSRWFPSLKSLDVGHLPALELVERGDGSGTISFAVSGSPFGARGYGGWSQALDPTPRFFRIDGARRVYELIQKQRES